MRKLLLTTAAVAAAIAGAVAGETAFGTFTDTRDGQTYKTVKIGQQTWMARNLNYKTLDSSWCYHNNPSYCKRDGRLYSWNAAMKACPVGYHLPSDEEWDCLEQAVGGEKNPDGNGTIGWYGAAKKLKARSGWLTDFGTNNYGFSALPSGWRVYNGAFGFDDYGNWWTATECDNDDSDCAYVRTMDCVSDDVYRNGTDKSTGYSVRCVADRP